MNSVKLCIESSEMGEPNETSDHSEVTIMKLMFLQRKDAEFYGEAGLTGSWRSQAPLNLLKTGQVDY